MPAYKETVIFRPDPQMGVWQIWKKQEKTVFFFFLRIQSFPSFS